MCNTGIYDTAGSRVAHGCVQRMESVEESFNTFLSERFPPNAKWSTSGVFWAKFGRQVIQVLRGPAVGDKNLWFFIKKHGLQLQDLPSLGVKEALVVPVKKNAKV